MNEARAERLRRRVARQYGLDVASPAPQPTDPVAHHSSAATPSGLARVSSLVDGFAATVQRHANRTALRCGGQGMSYRELDEASTALAGAVRARASTPEQPVAILLERSAEMVVAALAVLKAGLSYVPLDPATPAARINVILQDAAPVLAITSAELAPMLPEHLPVLGADPPAAPAGSGPTGAGSAPPAAWPVGSSTRAYLIFTSGTTGRPKGVQVTHGNVLRLFTTTEPLFGFGCQDMWSLFHSFAFDFSVWEVWGALLYGGCVVVVPRQAAKDPAAFRQLLAEERVTMLSQTPTAFAQLIAEDARWDNKLPVTRVMFSGEALHFCDLKPWMAKYGDAVPELINMYGITETTVHASYRRVLTADLDRRTSLIGHPLPDLDFLLVDDDLAPVPRGQLGEIVVTGPGVTSGYLARPELTRERFIELTDGTGNRVRGYRSGDLALITPTGEFEYHGRRDDQVKVRGFRVELGEVEGALRALDCLANAAVVVRELPELGESLVAYVVPSSSGDASASAVRRALKRVLPAYMIPSVVVPLDALPLTHNGKIDRRALPDPTAVPRDDTVIEAGDGVEAMILSILDTLLLTGPVHPTADFFELGGHSLLATQLLADVRDACGVDVPLQQFFRSPTARSLAELVREHGAEIGLPARPDIPATDTPTGQRSGPGLFALRRSPGGATPVFALPGALGFGSAFAQLSGHLANRSFYALETRDLLNAGDERPTLDALIEGCARTIAEAAEGRAVHLLGHSFGGCLGVHLVGPLQARGVRVAGLALLDPPSSAAQAGPPTRGREELLKSFLGHLAHLFPATASQRARKLFGQAGPLPEKTIFAEAGRLIAPGSAALLGTSLETAFEHYLRTTRLVWPEPDPVGCPALLLIAMDGRHERVGELQAGWARYLPASLVSRQIAASHDGMLRHPYARLVAAELAPFFARYDGQLAPATPANT